MQYCQEKRTIWCHLVANFVYYRKWCRLITTMLSDKSKRLKEDIVPINIMVKSCSYFCTVIWAVHKLALNRECVKILNSLSVQPRLEKCHRLWHWICLTLDSHLLNSGYLAPVSHPPECGIKLICTDSDIWQEHEQTCQNYIRRRLDWVCTNRIQYVFKPTLWWNLWRRRKNILLKF